MSILGGLTRALDLTREFGVDLDRREILRSWRDEPVRADVLRDYERGTSLPIQGSPQLIWPDGFTVHNRT